MSINGNICYHYCETGYTTRNTSYCKHSDKKGKTLSVNCEIYKGKDHIAVSQLYPLYMQKEGRILRRAGKLLWVSIAYIFQDTLSSAKDRIFSTFFDIPTFAYIPRR